MSDFTELFKGMGLSMMVHTTRIKMIKNGSTIMEPRDGVRGPFRAKEDKNGNMVLRSGEH